MAAQIAQKGGKPVRTAPWPRWPLFTDKDKADLVAVLDDGRLTSITGPKVREFEEKYAAAFGAKYALATCNGVVAIHLALAALEIGPGDEVIVPAHTFIGTSIPVLMANAIPVFVDIARDSFNIDVSLIEKAITPRTKAIVPVHLNGLPADMAEITAIAKRHGLAVVEDACQAHGAFYRGTRVGTLGDISCFSFFEDKVLTTGEGGMLVTNSQALYDLARCIRSYGEELVTNIGDRKYEHMRLGFNYRMGALPAALGINQLDRLDVMVQKRNANARYLREHLARVPGITAPKDFPDRLSAFYKFVCRIDTSVVRTDVLNFIEAIKAEGVPATPRYPRPLPLQKVYREKLGYGRTHCPYDCDKYGQDIDYRVGSWPEAERVGIEAFVLLVHPSEEQSDLADAVAAVEKVAAFYSKA
jgi:perosamine synthetase